MSKLFQSILCDYQGKIMTKNLFTSKIEPIISIQNYIQRIIKYSRVEESTLILSMIYIDRLCKFSGLEINKFNVHRLVSSSILLAIKFNEDNFFSNDYYSKIMGLSLSDLNKLEKEFNWISILQKTTTRYLE